jgi:FlaA1/EpsC-like NDP-sugar epimerase
MINFKDWKYWVVILGDALIIVVSYYLAFFIRFEWSVPGQYFSIFMRTLPIVAVVYFSSFFYFGLYRGLWHYASISDLLAILKAISVGMIGIILGIVLFHYGRPFPRSVFIIDWLLMIIFIGGSRFLIRLLKDIQIRPARRKGLKERQRMAKRVLIIGAGDAGEMMIREMQHNPKLNYYPIGFIDDDPAKLGRSIHGVRVLGQRKDLAEIVAQNSIDEAIIAIPSASGRTMRSLVESCQNAGVKFRTVPGVGDLINGTVKVNQIREVKVEDLLGREPVKLDVEAIKKYISGKRILVTGAGGSIGAELGRQVAKFNPQQLILLERAENSLFYIDMELRNDFPELSIISIVSDINDANHLNAIFQRYQPQVVFHAAAHKHVPLMEFNPQEVIKNNLFGTKKLAEVCAEYGVEELVMLSTDKAVNPISFMGVSKRLAELYLERLAQKNYKTKFIAVRFGNVLDSEGSVVPIFRRQIAEGGPVTVTHPEIKRYFMTISEAAQLVIQAGAMGKGGEIFILEMGTPIKIVDLARATITLSGLEPEEDIKIVFIGLRPGEKMYEELVAKSEMVKPTRHEKILSLQNKTDNDWSGFERDIKELEKLISGDDVESLVEKLKEIVPEYQPKITSQGPLL